MFLLHMVRTMSFQEAYYRIRWNALRDKFPYEHRLVEDVPEVMQTLLLYVAMWKPHLHDIFPLPPNAYALEKRLKFRIVYGEFPWSTELFSDGSPSFRVQAGVALLVVKEYVASLEVALLDPPEAWHSVGETLMNYHEQPFLTIIPYSVVSDVKPLLKKMTKGQSALLDQIVFLMRAIAKDQHGHVNGDQLLQLARFWAVAIARRHSIKGRLRCTFLSKNRYFEGIARVLFTLAYWNIRERENPFSRVFQLNRTLSPEALDLSDVRVSL
ncbi:uncharacterized protein LOC125042348 [Penaeus chinensis]|uniref:uncharacterized protein LOC125042348 n=1 Tax=Penaeus chinensis TaxID=139456 RepID=UPI001FB6025B|nr:uncharacterized protein LOC125042348 [Penaeus chinensis]